MLMLTPEQTEKIKKIIEAEEKTLYINTGTLIEIAEVLGLDGEYIEQEMDSTIWENDGGYSVSRKSAPGYTHDEELNKVFAVIDQIADKKYKYFAFRLER